MAVAAPSPRTPLTFRTQTIRVMLSSDPKPWSRPSSSLGQGLGSFLGQGLLFWSKLSSNSCSGAYTDTTECVYTFKKTSLDICSIRLDFVRFVIRGPDVNTGPQYTTCSYDTVIRSIREKYLETDEKDSYEDLWRNLDFIEYDKTLWYVCLC